MEKYNAKEAWTKAILSKEMAYPAEYVIRIFKGKYPKLDLDKHSFLDKKLCDLGCGDGRHFVLLKECGFKVYGVEITKEIVDTVKERIENILHEEQDIRVGNNSNIPFEDNFFDYLLSWNSCYYMNVEPDFRMCVKEISRIIKPEGYLILSIPKKTCFIYKNSDNIKEGYCIIRSDPHNIRNGEMLRVFEDEEEIKREFSEYFENFIFSSIHDDCFGFEYHWHLVVCQKKRSKEIP